MSTTHFWLIRHGETQWNADRRLQGWRDIPLNDAGLRQARQLGLVLRPPHFVTDIDVILSSDLGRAAETARIAAAHMDKPIETYAPLRERNYGIYEGLDWMHLKSDPNSGVYLSDPDWAVEEGESLAQFQQRIDAAFRELVARYTGRNVLVFSHGGVIDIAWRRASGVSLEMPRPSPILNTSINQFSIDGQGRWTLLDWGRSAHLDQAALDDVT